MEKIGIVLALDGDIAKVAVRRSSGCSGGCKTCGGCDTPNMIVHLPNKAGAKVGDTVELIADEKKVVGAIMYLYILPLVMFVIGIALTYWLLGLSNSKNLEVISFVIGMTFMAISYLLLKSFDKRIGRQDQVMMIMKSVVSSL